MRRICTTPECIEPVAGRGLCAHHYYKARKLGVLDEYPVNPNPSNGRERPIGSRSISRDGYVKIKTEQGVIGEHRAVMEQHLGRALVRGESVHHINGVRSDNRLENLELWFTTGQPSGQRVPDLIAYLVEHHRATLLASLARTGLVEA